MSFCLPSCVPFCAGIVRQCHVLNRSLACCRWEAHAAEGYKWWANRLGRAMQLYDETRIDHFRCGRGVKGL